MIIAELIGQLILTVIQAGLGLVAIIGFVCLLAWVASVVNDILLALRKKGPGQ